ncbi:transcription factor IIF subunit tfg1 [Saxophila tyrrhenica]|uniref:Transcription factor IIF subunit tfg1 n=1 Tax=Saxophila tyrrhenica TaxID=1690608 RepID=A0AAV9P8A0_9PEZI|nr:transcription factor IIF subunit tfg1 [Saxophila tyrrhenica]
MSASPAGGPTGPSSTTPSAGGPAPVARKKPNVSIFTPKRKPVVKKPAPGQSGGTQSQPINGAATGQQQAANGVKQEPAVKDYSEYPIYVSKNMIDEGLHYHTMKLKSREDKTINPYDVSQFPRPVRLHRRMARDKRALGEQLEAASGVDDKERELMSAKRAERQAEREANQALIAPTGGDAKKSTKKKPQKKVEDVYYDENNPKHRARAQLRYEEARPWHLEDFESKNIWVGSYEEPLADRSVMFEIGTEGFRMVPVEKWYTFTQTNRFEVMDSDAVEKHMGQKLKAPRWFLGTQMANDEARKQAAYQAREQQRIKRRGSEDEEMPIKREEYQADVDEIDFEFEGEFQDDDEGMIYGDQDEDAKEIERRIREEMRSANLAGSGLKDIDKDYDEEEAEEKRKEQERKRKQKRMRKQLIKKERKNEYDSDSDRGEFSESEESEDSEEERERLEEERKAEEARKLNDEKSGASTKGTNTPTGRSEKRDQSRLGASLKRPGSPDLSELSGNESSRKKAKGVNGRAVSSAANGARSLSPDTTKPKRASGYGSGSDTDTSRAGRPKINLKSGAVGSPVEGSRTASRVASPSHPASRTQSPSREPFPTLEEVRAAIPATGIDLKELVRVFRARVGNANQAAFIGLVKQAGKQDPASKKIVPKEGPSSGATYNSAS